MIVDFKRANEISARGLSLWLLLPNEKEKVRVLPLPLRLKALGKMFGWSAFWTTSAVDVWLLDDGHAIWWA